MPIINNIFIGFDKNGVPDNSPCAGPPEPLTLSCALGTMKSAFDNATGLSLTVDGVRLGNSFVRMFRPTSTSVADLWINPDPEKLLALGVFGYFPNKAVQDGYYVFLHHLTPGKHTIRTTGFEAAPFAGSYDVTTTVCVGVNTNVAGACRN